MTSHINKLLEDHNIHVSPNTTDLLQPMDIAVNKPAKDFLKRKFEHWYSNEVMKQFSNVSDVDSIELQPVNLCMAAIKELTAEWLVDMADYIADNPQFIVNGFLCAGIFNALDGEETCEESDNDRLDNNSDSDSDMSNLEDDVVLLK